jgi:hypothetical protein
MALLMLLIVPVSGCETIHEVIKKDMELQREAEKREQERAREEQKN